MTLIQSPLTVQVFAGLTIANVAFHRFGGVFKKKKSEDKAEEVLHHERQNDDSYYCSEDVGDRGESPIWWRILDLEDRSPFKEGLVRK
mmetsp:Transcript_26875/g.40353  ORF Transcript_26875/g.40353 Transcript_26875/m.40353 type:complete len:88 (+) Transcript_26875:844-1107(+)